MLRIPYHSTINQLTRWPSTENSIHIEHPIIGIIGIIDVKIYLYRWINCLQGCSGQTPTLTLASLTYLSASAVLTKRMHAPTPFFHLDQLSLVDARETYHISGSWDWFSTNHGRPGGKIPTTCWDNVHFSARYERYASMLSGSLAREKDHALKMDTRS